MRWKKWGGYSCTASPQASKDLLGLSGSVEFLLGEDVLPQLLESHGPGSVEVSWGSPKMPGVGVEVGVGFMGSSCGHLYAFIMSRWGRSGVAQIQ